MFFKMTIRFERQPPTINYSKIKLWSQFIHRSITTCCF